MRLLRPARSAATLVAVITMALASSLLVGISPATAANPHARVGAVAAVTSSYDSDILYWTNRARRAHGLRPLVAGSCVDRFAERWSWRMARSNRFGHQSLRPILRRCHRNAVAENIARGNRRTSAHTLVRMWMRSPGHRHNLLNRKYRYLGVAAWTSARTGHVYVTQDFSS